MFFTLLHAVLPYLICQIYRMDLYLFTVLVFIKLTKMRFRYGFVAVPVN